MSRRRAVRRRAAVALIALLVATLAPLTPAARGADETGPGEPVELPVQPGVANTFDPVRAQPPADITVGESGGGASPDLGQPRVEPPADIAPEARSDVADLRGEYHAITANPDGTYTATITGERQHYQDPDGAWQRIDTDLVEAAALRPGDEVVTLDDATGVVWSLDWSGGARTMHDLTVATVHTFAVGTGGWVVHNCGGAGPVRTGQSGEASVRSVYDIGKKEGYTVNGRDRISDGMTLTTLAEVKNVGRQAYTRQLRDAVDHAMSTGLQVNLFTRPSTHLSRPLRNAIADPRVPIDRYDIP